MELRPCLDKWPIKLIAIESRKDGRLGLTDVLEELSQKSGLIRLVEDGEHAHIVFRLGCVLEILDVLAYHLAVGNEEALAIHDVRNHHDLVKGAVREL